MIADVALKWNSFSEQKSWIKVIYFDIKKNV